MIGKIIDLIWKLDYPTSIIFSFFALFIPLKKKEHYTPKLIIGIVLILALGLLRLIPSIGNSAALEILYYLLTFGLIIVLLYFTIDNAELSNILFILSCIISLQHICYKFTVGIFILIDPVYLSSLWVYIPTFLLILFAGCLLTYFFFSRKVDISNLCTNSKYTIIGILLLIVTTVIINYFTYNIFFINIPNIKFISFLLNLSSIITAVLIIMFLYSSAISLNRKRENALIKLIADKDKERYELIKMSSEDINIKYHDLQHALKNQELDKELQEDIKESITNYKAIINTSNRGLNVVVYESQLKCISKNIDFNVLIDGDPITFVKSHHIYCLLSNLLDNAIEAEEKIEDITKRRISLKIYKKNDNVIINVTNYISSPVKFLGKYPKTNKKDRFTHGYGIKSVEQIVVKYKGNMSLKNDDNQFVINILIPIYHE